jgi:hypothetical protein
MCCVITALLFIGPRAALLIWWLLSPGRFSGVFDGLLVPLLGFLLLPWTTLMYVVAAPGGVAGLEWALLIVAFLVDLGAYGGGAYGNRRRSRW